MLRVASSRISAQRKQLFVLCAGVAAFLPLDVVFQVPQTAGLIGARVLLIGGSGLAAWLLPRLGERGRRGTLAGVGAMLPTAMTLLTLGTGGTTSPGFMFMWALPLAIGLMFVDEPLSAAAAGVTSVAGGIAVMLTEGQSGAPLAYFVMVTIVSAIIATASTVLHRRVKRAEVAEARAQQHALVAARERLSHADRVSSLGLLAASIAHEINNPLGVILAFGQGLEHRVPEGAPLRVPVMSIVREAERCKALVHEMLRFSRTNQGADEVVDVTDAVTSSLLLLESKAKTQQVEVVRELVAVLPPLRGSRTGVQQVLVNLGMNALDAMKAGGRLTVRASSSASEVMLEVEDTGPGIPEAVRAHLFEPFFTTKRVGEGTGLGLSLVHQIVQQHHGRIDVASSPRGACFRVTLPASAPANPANPESVDPFTRSQASASSARSRANLPAATALLRTRSR